MIEELIKSILKRYIHLINYEAEVIDVNKDNDTCTIQADDGPEIEGVKLKSVITDVTGKLVVYPKKGSFVTVSVLRNQPNELYVSQVSQVDEIVMDIENTIKVNGGNNGGLVNWPDAKEQIEKSNAMLKAIVDTLNGPPVNEAGNGAPSSLQAALQAAIAAEELGVFTDLEDTKVLH